MGFVVLWEDGGSTELWNIGIQPLHYMMQHPRKPQSTLIAVKTSNLTSLC